MVRVAIASDHAGFEMKQSIIEMLDEVSFIDLGTDSINSVDYPDYAENLAKYLRNHECTLGVLVCGSGIGMCMMANRFSHIRAVCAQDTDIVYLSRIHNHANVLCLGSRMIALPQAIKLIQTFINTEPTVSDRHINRIKKMTLQHNI